MEKWIRIVLSCYAIAATLIYSWAFTLIVLFKHEFESTKLDFSWRPQLYFTLYILSMLILFHVV